MLWRSKPTETYEVEVKMGDVSIKTLKASSFDDAAQQVTRQLGCSIRSVIAVRRVA